MTRGVYGEQLATRFRLSKPPTLVTQTIQNTEIAVTDIVCDAADNGLTAPIPREDALLATVQLRDCPRHDLWLDGKPVQTGHLKAGDTLLYDLQTSPIVNSVSPFRNMHFYLPRAALDAIAEADDASPTGDFNVNSGRALDNSVISGLAWALVPAFANPEEANQLFVDHITTGVAAYVARTFGGGRNAAPKRPPRLSSGQEARAKETIVASLDGDISIRELARECGLPVSTFSEAFRQSTGVLPHQWLLERRVDLAMSLLRQRQHSLRAVAAQCGFADAQHFARVFSQVTQMQPDTWRRMAAH